jgi:hypothetical protein
MSSLAKSLAGLFGKEKGYHMVQFEEIKEISKIPDPKDRNEKLDNKYKEIEAFVKHEDGTNRNTRKKNTLLTYIKFLKGEVSAGKIFGGLNTSTDVGWKIRSEIEKTMGGRRTRKNKHKNKMTRCKK